mmetsp:Transcript_58760/g.182243  ORF Transcript_58760/g.182243 Transcript_58760/m.182243 type:complete len:204 (+) Transcript_58760:315-926(+)
MGTPPTKILFGTKPPRFLAACAAMFIGFTLAAAAAFALAAATATGADGAGAGAGAGSGLGVGAGGGAAAGAASSSGASAEPAASGPASGGARTCVFGWTKSPAWPSPSAGVAWRGRSIVSMRAGMITCLWAPPWKDTVMQPFGSSNDPVLTASCNMSQISASSQFFVELFLAMTLSPTFQSWLGGADWSVPSTVSNAGMALLG